MTSLVLGTLRRARQVVRRAERATLHQQGLPANVRRAIGLAIGGAPPIGYLGFAGRGNAGDDAILLAHRRSLPGIGFGLLPLEWERETLALLGRARRRPLHSGVLFGGGTVVGREAWRRRLDLAQRASSGPVVFTGVGVEDPEFEGAVRHSDDYELERWAEILGHATYLTVRGPRSAELLRGIGVDAPVVSDPALLLGPDRPSDDAVRRRLLGLNIADPEDQYRGAGSRVFDACAAAARKLLQSGWSVRLLPFERRDLVLAKAFQRALDGRVEIVPRFLHIDALLESIRECDVLVGQRLHAVVLAAAVAVPALAVDYRPKCRDFQFSIGRNDWIVSTLDISAELVLDRVIELHSQRAEHARLIHGEVLKAKMALREGERALLRILSA